MKWNIQLMLVCGLLVLLAASVFFIDRSQIKYTHVKDIFTNIHSEGRAFGGSQSSVKETQSSVKETQPQFVITLCRKSPVLSDSDIYLRQLKMLLKSAALLTSTTLKFNILSDSEDLYKHIINITTEWPSEYRQRIIFSNYTELYYPPDFEGIRTMFTLCATACLFLMHNYANTDAVVYMDVDTLFMQPPEELWRELGNFESRQIVGVPAHLTRYNHPFNKFPVFGFSGINSGVLLMNLTRIRNYSKGWDESIKGVLDKYPNISKLSNFGDQDILNIMFSGGNMQYAYEIPCKWNYRVELCEQNRNVCPIAASDGVAVLHGCGKRFFNRSPSSKAVFDAWEEYDLRSPVQDLVSLMEKGLQQLPNGTLCRKLSNIDDILLKGLKRHLA